MVGFETRETKSMSRFWLGAAAIDVVFSKKADVAEQIITLLMNLRFAQNIYLEQRVFLVVVYVSFEFRISNKIMNDMITSVHLCLLL